MKLKHCKANLRWKKDIELQENGKYLYGIADVTSPTYGCEMRCEREYWSSFHVLGSSSKGGDDN